MLPGKGITCWKAIWSHPAVFFRPVVWCLGTWFIRLSGKVQSCASTSARRFCISTRVRRRKIEIGWIELQPGSVVNISISLPVSESYATAACLRSSSNAHKTMIVGHRATGWCRDLFFSELKIKSGMIPGWSPVGNKIGINSSIGSKGCNKKIMFQDISCFSGR